MTIDHGRSVNYLKSLDFPIHLMASWWLFWLGISYTPVNEFLAPSSATLMQFLLLIASFLLGHIAIKSLRPYRPHSYDASHRGLQLSPKLRLLMLFAALACFSMLLLSLAMAGAFNLGFSEYFIKIRVAGADTGTVEATGIHLLDVLTKIFAFPLSYTALVIVLAVGLLNLRRVFLICLISFCCFAYLWQINYPLIHLFWLMVFYLILTARRRGRISASLLATVVFVVAVLAASAVNRFGGEVVAGLQRYVLGYHLVGFSFYDQQYHDSHSLLHNPSFGRSSLGFLEQILENILKPFETGFRAASSENSDFTDAAIDIGASDTKFFNAFGTIVFTFYRDFQWLGVALGGFVYGAIATFARYRSEESWMHGALFLLLGAAWMMGMMVSPLEAAYFWFVIVALWLFRVVNRGVRW